jgi:Tfp pilus assembly protein PilE
MIVIAIIAILVAAITPQLTAYYARGRDTQRLSDVKEISNAHATFLVDRLVLPNPITPASSGSAMCASSVALALYLPKFPVDPVALRSSNCGTIGAYGYGTGTLSTAAKIFTISAVFENGGGGIRDQLPYINEDHLLIIF